MSAQVTALLKAIEEGKINSTKAEILSIIKRDGGNITEHTIGARMKESHLRATIIGRVSDLLDLGIVDIGGTYKGGTKSYYIYEPNPEKQEINRNRRSIDKYNRWEKKGNKLGYFKFREKNK